MTNWRPLWLAVVGWAAIAGLIVLIDRTSGGVTSHPPDLVTSSLRCPSVRVAGPHEGAGPLAMGATSAVLCTPRGDRSWLPPRDPLTTGLDRLVAAVDRTPITAAPGPNCVSSMSFDSYVVVVRYPDGDRTLAGQPGTCDTLTIGTVHHSGALAVWTRYLRLLAEQRRHTGWERSTRVPRCGRRPQEMRLSPLVQLSTLLTARLCPTDPNGDRIGGGVGVRRRVLSAVVHDVRHPPSWHGGEINRCLARRHRVSYLIATDAWHDRIAFRIECGTERRVTLNPDAGGALRPHTLRMLRRLSRAAR